MGLGLGLAVLSKASLLVAVPFCLGWVVLMALKERESWRTIAGRALRVLLPVGLISGWWFVRNWLLYGDPFGTAMFVTVAGGSTELRGWGVILAAMPGIWLSFWALFGWFSIRVDPGVYLFFDAVALAGLAGLCAFLWQARHDRAKWTGVLGLVAWSVLSLVVVARLQLQLSAAQGRLLFPAISAISVLLALGLTSIVPRAAAKATMYVVLSGMLAISCVSPLRYIAPAYAAPPRLVENELSSVPAKAGIVFGDQLELVGYSPAILSAAPEGRLDVVLYLRAREPMTNNYVISVQLFDVNGVRLAQSDSYPGLGTLPTSRLKLGEAMRDTRYLLVSSSRSTSQPGRPAREVDPSQPRVGRLVVSAYQVGHQPLEAKDPRGVSLGTSVEVTQVKLGVPTIRPILSDASQTLGGQLALLDYSLAGRDLASGAVLQGSITWQAIRRPEANYTAFVQVIGAGGLVGQYDSQPLAGSYPVSRWDPGEAVEDAFAISLANAEPGEYRVIAGFYDLSSGLRLRTDRADYLDLGTFRVR